MRIAMIGTGYVGLVSGACFADFGHSVTLRRQGRSARSTASTPGVMPIWEPGLEALVKANVERGRLTFTTDLAEGVEGRGSGVHRGRHAGAARRRPCRPDLRVRGGARARQGDRAGNRRRHQVDRPGRHRRQDRAKSCAKRASTERLGRLQPRIPARRRGDRRLQASRPHRRRRRGRARAARCCAKSTGRCSSTARRSCSPARRTAELTKYAANAFLAVKISFINEIADLCEAVDADVQDVARGIGLDNRIGPKFLHAGPGYGGSCFPKDTLALLQTADDGRRRRSGSSGPRSRSTTTARRAMAERVERALGGDLAGKRIGVLGLAFKPNTDDMREAPSIPLIKGAGRARRRGQRLRSGRARAGRADLRGHRVRRRRLSPRPRAPTRW